MTCPLPPQKRDPEAGLTLVEVLVVLSIIAIVTGAAMLRLGIGRGGDDLAASAITLALAITEASDRALVSGQDEQVDIGPEGFRVFQIGTDAAPPWRAMTHATFSDPVSATYVLAADGTSAPFSVRLKSDSTSTVLRFDGLRATVSP